LRYHETEIRVRFYEADMWRMGWHGNYVGWFEAGRVDLARMYELLPTHFSDLGYVAPVININIDFKDMARFDDVLTIRTSVLVPAKAALVFNYEAVRKTDGKLLARGETTQVLLRDNGEMMYVIPSPIKERVEDMVRWCNPDVA
jgi:acyl-CoA thioester hydrolase